MHRPGIPVLVRATDDACMKVLVLHEAPLARLGDRPVEIQASVGGLPTYLGVLNLALEASGCVVLSARFIAGLKAPRRVSDRAWELPAVSLRPGLAARRALREVLREAAPDVVHMHSVFYAIH